MPEQLLRWNIKISTDFGALSFYCLLHTKSR